MTPDRSTSQNPTSDLQHGSKTDMGGGSGPLITQDSAEDSDDWWAVPDDSMGVPGYHYYEEDPDG